MKKVDLKKELKDFYQPSTKEVTLIDVPNMNFIMVDGKGDPNISKDYHEAIEILFSVSYGLKFACKKGDVGIDYTVMPLESLWWVENNQEFSLQKKEAWLWTAMILQPAWITESLFQEVKNKVAKKKTGLPLHKAYFKSFAEGKSAQIMYIGTYQNEGPTITKIHQTIVETGGKIHGKHHEIYLSDPRKTSSEKLKTIIRQPYI